MKHLTRKMLSLGIALGVALSFDTAVKEAAAGWEPKKPVEFVIMAGKGGGADKMARLMQTIIAKHNLSSKPFTPINKPGGSGAESLIYLKQKTGDNHTIMVTLNSFYTTPLRNPGLGIDITTFTPVGRMAEDTFLLWVHSDTDINSVEDFVKAVKAKGGDWIMAGTGKGQEDQLLTSFLNKAYGLNMKYVPYKGGGRVAKELAGKKRQLHGQQPVRAAWLLPGGQDPAAGRLHAGPPAAIRGRSNLPRAGQGLCLLHAAQRGRSAGHERRSRGLLPGSLQEGLRLGGMAGVQEKKSLLGDFMTGSALMDYWKKERAIHKTILTDIGEIK